MAFKASSAEAAKLLQEIEGTERRLKQALKTSQPDEREVKALRTGLMGSYERMLVLDYELASKNQVEQNLWKIVFYKRIEEFRKRHGKTSALLDDPDKKERAKQALSQITAAFARFLDKSSRFYMSLLRKLLVACNVSLAGYTDHGEDDEGPSFVRCDESSPKHRERKKAMLMSSERCLIFLGDLERYRSLYMEKELERDWSAAERHYRTAALLTPHVGNPHNQLAVLATYCGADLEGMFHYARAALVPQPFATARENLALLLDKNRQKLEAIVAAKPSVPPRIALEEKGRRRREELGVRFVRVHGMLQTHSPRDLEQFAAEEGAMLVQLVATLDADDLPHEAVLWMAVVCLFSAADLATRAAQLSHIASPAGPPHPVLLAQQFAVGVALKVLSRLAVSARGRPGHLQAVGVLCAWLHFSPHTLSSPPDADGSGQLRRELQTAAGALVDLLNLQKEREERAGGASAWGVDEVLPEDKELAGFEPLAEAPDRKSVV